MASLAGQAECIVTSAEKKLTKAVSDGIIAIAGGTAKGGNVLYGADNDGIGLSPFYQFDGNVITDEIQAASTAFAAWPPATSMPCRAVRAAATPVEADPGPESPHLSGPTERAGPLGRPAQPSSGSTIADDRRLSRRPASTAAVTRPAARDARHHQALSRRGRQRRHRPRRARRARSTPCWARTAPASRR